MIFVHLLATTSSYSGHCPRSAERVSPRGAVRAMLQNIAAADVDSCDGLQESGGRRAPAHLRSNSAFGYQLPVANCSCLSNGDDVTSCFGCYCCQSNPNTLKH